MHQPASRALHAAFSRMVKKQPNVCIETIVTPLLLQKQFGKLNIKQFCVHIVCLNQCAHELNLVQVQLIQSLFVHWFVEEILKITYFHCGGIFSAFVHDYNYLHLICYFTLQNTC